MAKPTPIDDPLRLRTLREAVLLDTPAEEAFDRLTGLATRILDAPVSLVSLVDEDRQFFKSCVGLPEPWATERETPLSHSFCQHTVTTGEPLIIADAREHPLVRDNAAVAELNAIAYAGIPLELDGQPLGSFCVVDSQPRVWTDREVDILGTLAESVMAEIQLRVTAMELERTAREREEVLSIVSHDLRSPLGTVVAGSELLETDRLSPDQRDHQLRIIRRAGQRMLRLTSDLLDLARLDAGSLDLDRRPTALAALMRESAEHAEIADGSPADSRITVESPDDGVTVDIDENRLHQALGNLLNNALRVTPDDGRITLRAEIETAGPGPGALTLRLVVEDDGPGIPLEDLPHIFERYFQGPEETRGSSGLGLAMVRVIATAHGGSVRAENRPEGGARFTMELPASVPSAYR